MTLDSIKNNQGRFTLRSSIPSPFSRKVRIAADILGLGDRIDLINADTLDESDSLRGQNPLGKIPCLLLPDGVAIYDSRVIVEFLQEVAGTNRLLAAHGMPRYLALTRAALADGIADAALLIVYESRFRPPEAKVERWVLHQRGKVMRGLAAFDAAPPDSGTIDIVSLGLGCALDYLDLRKPVEWRPTFPRLVDWLDRFAASHPAFLQSRPN